MNSPVGKHAEPPGWAGAPFQRALVALTFFEATVEQCVAAGLVWG